MKNISTMALMIHLGVAGIYAQTGPFNMKLSGTAAASTINLRPGATTSEYHLVGRGKLGQFDLRTVSVSAPSSQQSDTCSGSTKRYLSAVSGGGVFRFADGSLLKVFLTGGGDCIDFSAGEALCIRVFRITGGTGRFQNASEGAVTLTMTVVPVLGDASNNSVFFAVTGGVTAEVPGADLERGAEDARP
jgi:hypothetical protein